MILARRDDRLGVPRQALAVSGGWGARLRALRGAICLAAIAVAPGWAAAAAWPREEGGSFLSFTLRSTLDGPDFGDYASLYYEYGLTEKLTFGLDVGGNIANGQTTAIAFLRHPVFQGDGPDVFALSLGVGVTDRPGGASATLRPGFSWGRPISGRWGSGWLGIESTFALYDDGGSLAKIEGTFGINHANGSLTILQAILSDPSGGSHELAIEAAHVFKIADRSFVELGLSYEFRQRTTVAKLGVWQSF